MDSLTQKVGPLPVWVYGVLVGGGLYLYRKSHPADTTSTTSAGTTSSGAGSDPTSTGSGTGGTMPSTAPQVPNNTDNGSAEPTPQTNADWKQHAISQLLTLNAWSAYTIEQALSAYLSGSPLDATQQTIVSQAIRMVGATPTAVPIASGSGGTTTTVTVVTLTVAGAIQPVANAGRTVARVKLVGKLYANGKPQSGTLAVQELNSFTGNTWSQVASMSVSGGTGSATINLAKGTNRIRLQTKDAQNTSNQVSISA